MSVSLAEARQVDELAELAEEALRTGDEEGVIPNVRAGAERHESALLWQWTALLQRSLDDHQNALDSFAEAARLAPTDAKIAHGYAQTAREAGVDAVPMFERAHSLAPRNGPILLGLAAARAAIGDGDRGANELSRVLDRSPMWTYGHEQLAQLLATLGRADEATGTLRKAISQFPREPALWGALLNVELRRGAYEALGDILGQAKAAGASSPEFAIYEAIHAAEFSSELYPPALFAAAPSEIGSTLDTWRVRHLLRVGAVEAALPIIDRGLEGDHSADLWPYAATAWRMAGDPRWDWLAGDSEFVRVLDLTEDLPPLEQLAAALRSLHVAKSEYLDQSVRGGTQTDGPLFCRIDPLIRSVRTAAAKAVRRYISNLPPVDQRHPLLRHRRDRRVRFSGSWSVRLRSGGRHSNHVHPQGWISSALYVALPSQSADEPEDSGWLTLGEPDARLQLDVCPWRKIKPEPARLVLFPSWMWHGTVPFGEGERLTVAFDVQHPI